MRHVGAPLRARLKRRRLPCPGALSAATARASQFKMPWISTLVCPAHVVRGSGFGAFYIRVSANRGPFNVSAWSRLLPSARTQQMRTGPPFAARPVLFATRTSSVGDPNGLSTSLGRTARAFSLDQFYQNIVFETCRRSRPPGWAPFGKSYYAAL